MTDLTDQPMDPTTGRRGEVLAALREAAAPLTIAALADELGVHVNTVRFHLDALTERGLVERRSGTPDGAGRPADVFVVRRRMDPAGPRSFALLARMFIDDLDAQPDAAGAARELGRRWGRDAVRRRPGKPVEALVDLLEDVGFAPQRVADQIGLHNCPFLELAEEEPGVVCSVHLGLMQGALQDTDRDVARLDPFVRPDLCVAHLAALATP